MFTVDIPTVIPRWRNRQRGWLLTTRFEVRVLVEEPDIKTVLRDGSSLRESPGHALLGAFVFSASISAMLRQLPLLQQDSPSKADALEMQLQPSMIDSEIPAFSPLILQFSV